MSDERVKSRVSYSQELRREATENLKGMVTISVTRPDGSRTEVQVAADLGECHFATWAAAMLGRRDVRPLPDLEEVVRRVCEERGISG